ncbi:ABC transporter permease [Geothermobacter hydrogeniphilus]|uniref:ABC transporter permease n=1 Tax=Geothermobacter hydrogeniphilus TaxID=1969733 RepID=A0A2K2HBK8_9BACT|nr:ABC transporter permease [Geothermobacter hydrogeniphilus]PNU20623.1 ABC transporter permease [Geothermobacter hydrogeniphilus]
MRALWASFCKDLLLLWRDRAGLALLFVMPMALVLVVSLVQNNVLESTGQKAFKVLFVDQDRGEAGRQLRRRLEQNGGMVLVSSLGGRPLTAPEARELVAAGVFQFAILLPGGLESDLQQAVEKIGQQILAGAEAAPEAPAKVEVCFDPTVQGVFRTAVLASLRHALLGIETQRRGRELATAMAGQSGRAVNPFAGSPLLQVAESPAGQALLHPNAVQQNVPAWSLFGMFFIVVPLGGALLRERQQGTLQRLLCLPVSGWPLLSGKLLAYASICLVQFGLMLLVGRFFLPLLGTPVLQIGAHPGVVLLLSFVSALAATGYGLLVGVLARSYEQASMLGAISVVIAAAIGGVMVPVYVMPSGMQRLSQLSPLGWGLEGFLKLFVRGGDLASVWPQVAAMLAFFSVTLALSLLIFNGRHKKGG